MQRRQFLAAGFGAGVAGLAGCGRQMAETGTPTATEVGTPSGVPASVGLETVATGLEAPVSLVSPPGADRRYVAEQHGVVHVHEQGGLRDDPFLDLRGDITVGRESGLLGLALHPEFASNRRLYVRYSDALRDSMPDDYSHTFVLAEFEATADGLGVRRDSERVLLEIAEPQGNHNAGGIAFGPEGYLHVGVGDGGSHGDQGTGHVGDWYDAVGGGNGQDVTENLLGSMLRIDVDERRSSARRTQSDDVDAREGDRPYGIPDDNPLVGREGLDEHYAWGFRNPWRFSFDGDDLYVGDVGQNRYEEVDHVVKGGNYGWNVKEGTHCFGADTCPEEAPAGVPGGGPLRDPVVEYPHGDAPVSGISVIGGYVYRGSAVPDLQGAYVFGDLQAKGRLFVATPTDEGMWPTGVLDVAGDAGRLKQLLSFGRGANGDLFVLGIGEDGGGVHRIVPA